MYISAVVADTKVHARAIIRWLGLDDHIWVPVPYGQKLVTIYENVMIVRPLSGVTDDHRAWIVDQLLPRVGRRRNTIPHSWEPMGSVDIDSELGFATMWV